MPKNALIAVKLSPRIRKAKRAPISEEVEKIAPVFIAPISLRANRNSTMEKPMLKAPTVNTYGRL